VAAALNGTAAAPSLTPGWRCSRSGDRDDPELRDGTLWPNFMATLGSVFGLVFAIEGFSFFMEAIFIGISVYG
jgi:Cytochrome bd terminal oxidase subunit I